MDSIRLTSTKPRITTRARIRAKSKRATAVSDVESTIESPGSDVSLVAGGNAAARVAGDVAAADGDGDIVIDAIVAVGV